MRARAEASDLCTLRAMKRFTLSALLVLVVAAPAVAQDVRGLEVCTAEKAMERRTSCLQSNIEFLQQALAKQKRESQTALDALRRETDGQKVSLPRSRRRWPNLSRSSRS